MIDQNLDTFFYLSDFAIEVTYKFQSGTEKTIKAIYDNDYISSMMEGIIVENANPRIIAKTSDIANARIGDTIVVNGITFNVINVRPDGTGITTIELTTNAMDDQ